MNDAAAVYSYFDIGVNGACLSELCDDVIADDALMHMVDAPRGVRPIRSADAKGRMCWRNILPHGNMLREISSNIRHRF